MRNILKELELNRKRFPEIIETARRTLFKHAWFQDEILLPVLRAELPVEIPVIDEIFQEHRELDHLMKTFGDASLDIKSEFKSKVLRIRTIIETHFKKEADVLYPLAERTVDVETLERLGEEMANQDEFREAA